jgi:hypothetical protein
LTLFFRRNYNNFKNFSCISIIILLTTHKILFLSFQKHNIMKKSGVHHGNEPLFNQTDLLSDCCTMHYYFKVAILNVLMATNDVFIIIIIVIAVFLNSRL